MQKLLLFALAIGLFITACKKTEAPTGFNDPVFMVSYQTDSLPNDTITAGVNGVYLFTNYNVSGNVFHSYNTFADASCPTGDCPGSLRFEFKGNALVDSAFSGPFYSDTFLIGGLYDYTLPDSLAQNASYYSVSFNWGDIFQKFTDHTLTFWAPPFVYTVITPISGSASFQQLKDTVQTISLESTGANGLHGTIQRTILPSNPHAYPAVSIKATPNGVGRYTLTAFNDWSNSSNIIQYQWNTGQSSDTISVDSITAFQEYFVTVTDAHDQNAVASLSSLPFPALSEIRNAQLSIQTFPYTNFEQVGTVAIQWVDSLGTIWRTDRQQQPSDFKFKILEASKYEPNENGDPTRKLKVSFNCLLFNEAGASRPLSGGGIIAMARN